MQKRWSRFFMALMFCAFLTGCTPGGQTSGEETEQSGEPVIEYEVPEEAENFDFEYQFVPEE